MQQVGLVCDLDFSRHNLFRNYYYALNALYGQVKLVYTPADLIGLDMLFIGDDHYSVHRDIITQIGFVNKCNILNIKVVVLGNERIFGTVFPWNEENNRFLDNFKNLYHYNYDVGDCKRLGIKLNRLSMSRHYQMQVDLDIKINGIVFIGSIDGPRKTYNPRRQFLNKLQKYMQVKIFPPIFPTWEQYIQTMAKYRYVLCPLGNANALALRFYEALLVHSIPLQQIEEDTLTYYDTEGGFEDCIFFQTPVELVKKLCGNIHKYSTSEMWMEDTLGKILREDDLL